MYKKKFAAAMCGFLTFSAVLVEDGGTTF